RYRANALLICRRRRKRDGIRVKEEGHLRVIEHLCPKCPGEIAPSERSPLRKPRHDAVGWRDSRIPQDLRQLRAEWKLVHAQGAFNLRIIGLDLPLVDWPRRRRRSCIRLK